MSCSESMYPVSRTRQMSRLKKLFTCLTLLFTSFLLSILIHSSTIQRPTLNGRFIKHHTIEDNGKPETMVVILTYMRSGSTLTGDVIQRSPDVFYVFEPLWWVTRLQKADIGVIHVDKRPSSRFNQSRDILEAFLTCNMQHLDVYTLRQNHFYTSPDTLPYYSCMRRHPGVLGAMSCLPLLETPCRKSRVSVVKTIRFDIDGLYALLEAYPGMKVIHLIRDPRSTLRSQHAFGIFRWKELALYAKQHCKRVLKDLESSAVLQAQFPSRIATLRYEDLVLRQEKVLQDLYSFIGLNLTDDIRDYVHNITSSGEWCPICTAMNGTAMLSKWRMKLSYKHAAVIDNSCGSVYKKLSYSPLADESTLTNLSISLIDDLPRI